MFFSSSVAALLVLALGQSVFAHGGVEPALGIQGGTLTRNAVGRPSTNAPCGNTNIAQTIDSSTAVTATNGAFTLTGISFNGGQDGSRQFTAKVNADGTGSKFVAATVTKNGQNAPSAAGTDQITVQLPAGTTCTGGKAGNLCVVSFVSGGGFGNCAVVQQGAGGATNANANAATTTSAAAAATPTTTTATGNGNGNGNAANGNGNGRHRGNNNKAGTGHHVCSDSASTAAAATSTDTAAAATSTDTAAAATSTDTAAAASTDTAAATSTDTAAASASTTAAARKAKREFVPAGTRAARAMRRMERGSWDA